MNRIPNLFTHIKKRLSNLIPKLPKRSDPLPLPQSIRHLDTDVLEKTLNSIKPYQDLITPELIEKLPRFNNMVKTVDLGIDNQTLIGKLLEGGGTKTAYEINRNGVKEVILLPNKAGNWKQVLEEVPNTKKIKEMGLLTNDYCDVQLVAVNGQTFPALKMKPYSEHNFKIFDSKNRRSSTGKLEVTISADDLTADKIVSRFDGILTDIQTLLNHNVRLGSDCFNLAQMKNGNLRLFFNDLGEIPNQSEAIENKEKLARVYITRAVDNFFNGFSDEAYYSPNSKLEELSSSENIDLIVNKLIEKFNTTH